MQFQQHPHILTDEVPKDLTEDELVDQLRLAIQLGNMSKIRDLANALGNGRQIGDASIKKRVEGIVTEAFQILSKTLPK